uniref:Uncharacterized protein n=2 Tax=unclassified Caudoviricetes TaxID=2788787 RepID=A0A8S5T6Q5_9CAUD|nr:MAG TPA: hypothetical protein [Myoviridae sp. cta6i12]DAF91368.1 MAG TPA: hypothetical protein [Myoviridae sp. ctZYN8]DAJ78861.1 MAG TPA: hypothetical protein [Caudoviricetes sp.]
MQLLVRVVFCPVQGEKGGIHAKSAVNHSEA